MKIYVNYLNDTKIVSNKILTPIQVGRAVSNQTLNMIGDDTGDTISEKNSIYCELTGQYWAWKNDKESSYLGFMHYRRFLDFSKENHPCDKLHGIIEDKIDKDFITKYGLTADNITKVVSNYDAIVPNSFNVNLAGFDSVEDNYKVSENHKASDLDLMKSVFINKHPDDEKYLNAMLEGDILYPCNMFIFKKQLFDDYCNWLFPILFELEKEIDFASYKNWQEKRVLGYLAERLFTAFVLKIQDDPKLKIHYLNRVIVKDVSYKTLCPKMPKTNLPIISVVLSSDRNYLPHLCALIASMILNLDKNKYLDLIILNDGLTDDELRSVSFLEKYSENVKISYIDLSDKFQNVSMHSYFSRSTLYRLFLPDLLTNRKKVLFLDTDMIVLSDLSDLFDIDVSNHAIAAVKDTTMQTFCILGVRSVGNLPASNYIQKHLGLQKESDYFQAGTLILNLEYMRDRYIGKRMIKDAENNTFWFLDQDILNKHCNTKVHYLDHSWNAIVIPQSHVDVLPEDVKLTYKQSISNPKIIHFAGVDKPWNGAANLFSFHYWYYLKFTLYYETVLLRVVRKDIKLNSSTVDATEQSSTLRKLSIRLWHYLPTKLRKFLFPLAHRVDKWIW